MPGRIAALVHGPGYSGLRDPGVTRADRDDIERIEAVRDEAPAQHKYDFRVMRSPGEVRWFSAGGGGIYDQAGDIVRVLGVNIDVTERKQVEQALAEKTPGWKN